MVFVNTSPKSYYRISLHFALCEALRIRDLVTSRKPLSQSESTGLVLDVTPLRQRATAPSQEVAG
jgi:hypothetical protein